MKKKVIVLTVAVACFGFGLGLLAAAEPPGSNITTPNRPDTGLHEAAFHRAHGVTTPVPLPIPVEPEGFSASLKAGPTADSLASGSGLGSAVAIVGPRGAAVRDPRQVAEQEIRKVIRKLG